MWLKGNCNLLNKNWVIDESTKDKNALLFLTLKYTYFDMFLHSKCWYDRINNTRIDFLHSVGLFGLLKNWKRKKAQFYSDGVWWVRKWTNKTVDKRKSRIIQSWSHAAWNLWIRDSSWWFHIIPGYHYTLVYF